MQSSLWKIHKIKSIKSYTRAKKKIISRKEKEVERVVIT
jgi:hypothetical protein